MTENENSVILNRMQTIVDLYDRNTTIADIAQMTGLSYSKVQKILSKNNYFHGIKMTEGTANHPMNAVIFINDFKFLLEYPNIDSLR